MRLKPKITHGRLLELVEYDPETGVFRTRLKRGPLRKNAPLGSVNERGYVKIKLDRIEYAAHRLAWFYETGRWPPRQIDHRNRRRADNRFDNLRLATGSQNMGNTRRLDTNTSGFKGVSAFRGQWKATITAQAAGGQVHLGLFATAEEAHAAYVEAARRYFGDFARAA